MASGQVAFDRPDNFAIVGELALTADTRPIKGILSMAIQAVAEGARACPSPGPMRPRRPSSPDDLRARLLSDSLRIWSGFL